MGTSMRSMSFSRFASRVASLSGRTATFALAAGTVAVWAGIGPFVDYSDEWQLTINTATTIVTFLMVFLIQNTQNRDSRAMQIKLDELIRTTKHAHNALLDLEELSEEELDAFRSCYTEIAREARRRGLIGRRDEGTPRVILPGMEGNAKPHQSDSVR
jgi:low affinity Fe/Cu permease